MIQIPPGYTDVNGLQNVEPPMKACNEIRTLQMHIISTVNR
jgi:hypothetical protein